MATTEKQVTSVFTGRGERPVVHDAVDSDEETLVALGYKQEFKRDLTWVESFCVSFSVLGLLPSIAYSTLNFNLAYGGQASVVWGWLIAAVCIQSVVFGMAELCSSMPTAGGLYYASAVLAPEGWGPLAAWIVGWSNALAFAIGPASINYAMASMVLAAAQIDNPNYVVQQWQLYLTYLLICAIQCAITMQKTKFLGRVNIVGTAINLIVLFVFIIWLPVASVQRPKFNNNRTVWLDFENGTEWPIGWAVIMGFTSVLYTFAGYDTPFHMSEECSNASIAGPRAIVMSGQLALYLGFAIVLVIGYCVKDITDVVFGQYGQPMASLCVQVLGKESGLAMFCLNIVAQFFVGQGIIISGSRVIFAYSRDGALPGSRWWSKVDKRTKTPVNAIWFIFCVEALIGLLGFGGPTVIFAIFSITGIAQYVAFVTPIGLKLFFAGDKFKPGPWHLGRFSKPIGVIAVAWLLVIIPALMFPATKGKDLNSVNMNYTCVIYGGTMTIALVYYAFSARKWFKGPRVNVEHLVHQPQDIQGASGRPLAIDAEKK